MKRVGSSGGYRGRVKRGGSRGDVVRMCHHAVVQPVDAPPYRALQNTKVVLVSPKVQENIGSVLRAAANFEAGSVVVVQPRCDPFGPDVMRVACGSPLLDDMIVLPTLEDALSNTITSIAFTRRAGRGRVTHASLRSLFSTFTDLMPQCSMQRVENDLSVALVFGREENGLTDSEVASCAHACSIPSGRLFPSLNLSHAVAVILSQIYEDLQIAETTKSTEDERISYVRKRWSTSASKADVDKVLERAGRLLEMAGISSIETSGGGDKGNHGRRKMAFGHLKALLTRSQATTAEVRALHALLRELER